MIFVVEDDRAIRELELYALKQAGFEATGFEKGEPFFLALHDTLPELVLLDVMLPDEDGVTILKRLRANPRTQGVPVILVTAKGEEMDKVTGLDSGADDYIPKPFGVMELLSRIRAVMRRCGERIRPERLTVGGVSIDPNTRECTVFGQSVQLTNKEYELLVFLMSNPKIVFSREKLLDAVWQQDYMGDTRTVDVHVGTLRQKLGRGGEILSTVRGVGYRVMDK